NLDACWFWKDEVAGFVPDEPRVGATRDVAAPLVRRIARCHLVDDVRGQTPPFAEKDVETARLVATVTAVDGDAVTLRLEGAAKLVARGRWRVEGLKDVEPTEQTRGFDGTLLGRATWDRKAARFTAFE